MTKSISIPADRPEPELLPLAEQSLCVPVGRLLLAVLPKLSSSTPFPSVSSCSFCFSPVSSARVQSVHCCGCDEWLRRGAHSNRSVEPVVPPCHAASTNCRLCTELTRCGCVCMRCAVVGMRWQFDPTHSGPDATATEPLQPPTRNSIIHSFTHSLSHDACSGH